LATLELGIIFALEKIERGEVPTLIWIWIRKFSMNPIADPDKIFTLTFFKIMFISFLIYCMEDKDEFN